MSLLRPVFPALATPVAVRCLRVLSAVPQICWEAARAVGPKEQPDQGCPIVNTKVTEDNLRRLVQDRDLCWDLGQRERAYMLNYRSLEQIGALFDAQYCEMYNAPPGWTTSAERGTIAQP